VNDYVGAISARRWIWVAGGVAVAMIIAGLVWSASSGEAKRAVVKPRVVASRPEAAPAPVPAAPRPAQPRVAVKVIAKSRPEAKSASTSSCSSAARAAAALITPRSMFPMGDVTRGLPLASVELYRPPAEAFPSFGYGSKIWNFSGRFARPRQVELAPTGLFLGRRKLFALANTAGPGSALFLQSSTDPGRFAIYRSPCIDKSCVWR
jgi:hypothetical protein